MAPLAQVSVLLPSESGRVPLRLPDHAAPWSTEPSLLILHASSDLRDELTSVAADWRQRHPNCHLLGCTTETAIGSAREYEETSAIVALTLALPQADLSLFGLEFVTTREGNAFVGWPDRDRFWDQAQAILAIGDPFTFPMDAWLERMNEDRPGLPIVGGMCSGGHEPGGSRIIVDDCVLDQGGAFAVLRGDFGIRTMVSQGCRAIGELATVTRSERNAILELDGQPALKVLHDLFRSLPTQEQETFRHGLQLSRRIDGSNYGAADDPFLARNVVGIEPELQGIVVGDYFREGDIVRFQLRDENAADFDLRSKLRSLSSSLTQAPSAGVMYSCNGRGTRLFSVPDHDAATVANQWPGVPLVGCHAAGEIGPIGGSNFFHGFAASLLLFTEASSQS